MEGLKTLTPCGGLFVFHSMELSFLQKKPMEKDKIKSFKISPSPILEKTGFGDISKKDWWKFKKMTREEYRNTAGACLLIGLIMPPVFYAGIISGAIWIYKVIRKQQ
ncbi:MAG: hypothetical protein WCQ32_02485 [bacterium]